MKRVTYNGLLVILGILVSLCLVAIACFLTELSFDAINGTLLQFDSIPKDQLSKMYQLELIKALPVLILVWFLTIIGIVVTMVLSFRLGKKVDLEETYVS